MSSNIKNLHELDPNVSSNPQDLEKASVLVSNAAGLGLRDLHAMEATEQSDNS